MGGTNWKRIRDGRVYIFDVVVNYACYLVNKYAPWSPEVEDKTLEVFNRAVEDAKSH